MHLFIEKDMISVKDGCVILLHFEGKHQLLNMKILFVKLQKYGRFPQTQEILLETSKQSLELAKIEIPA